MEPLLRVEGDVTENIPCSKKKKFFFNLVTMVLLISPILVSIIYLHNRFK